MRNCLFPKTVIRVYLIRQFSIRYINKYKLYSEMMAKNIKISRLFGKYENLFLYYLKDDKVVKKSYLIKSYRLKINHFEKLINGHRYIFWYTKIGRINNSYMKVSEMKFLERKNEYLKNYKSTNRNINKL